MTNNVVIYLYNDFGDNMKKVFIISIVLGIIFSLIFYLNYKKNNNEFKDIDTLYFIQISAYKNVKSISTETKKLESYLIIKEEDNLYHIYVGLTKKLKNLEKIKEFYKKSDDNIYVRKKRVNCKKFISELENYEILLSSAESKSAIEKVEKEVLNKYKEYNCENIRNG